MAYFKKENNQEKMDFLLMVLNENKKHNKKDHVLYYSIYIIRYGVKVPVMHREPTSTDIREQIVNYSTQEAFKPDFIIVDLFTGKSRNTNKAIASFKFDYRSKSL